MPGKVVSVTDTQVMMAVSDDAQQSNTADFTFNLKPPLKTPPAPGAMLTLVGTFDSYTQKPPMIILSDGHEQTKAPARTTRRTTRRSTTTH